MMRLYYDADTGIPTATMICTPGFAPDLGPDFVEIEEQELGDLTLWRVKDGALVALTEEALEKVRASAIAEVNRVSGEIRARFITVIPGQEMLYLLKEREAIRWLEATSPDPADYELIAAEVGITAPDAGQVAQVYVNMAAMLRQTAAQLETLRLGTIAVMEGASETAAIEAALAQFLTVAAQ